VARLSWWIFSPYSDWSVARRGRRDGRADPPLPPWSAEQLPPFLNELKELGDSSINSISRDWSSRDEKLEPLVRDALHERNAAAEDRSVLQKRYEAAREHYRDVHGVSPQDGVSGLFRTYYIVLFLLFIGEFPINMFIFRLFGENELLTAAVTFALAMAILCSAHFLGDQLRQGAFRSKKNTAITLVMILVPAAVLIGISWARKDYLGQMGGIAAELDPSMLLLVFLSLNTLIYVVATFLSHYVHDEPTKALHLASRALTRGEARLSAAEDRLAKAQAARRETWERHRRLALEMQDAVERLANIYWRENLHARSDRGEHEGEYPAAYQERLELHIPRALKEFREVAPDEGAPRDERAAELNAAATAEGTGADAQE